MNDRRTFRRLMVAAALVAIPLVALLTAPPSRADEDISQTRSVSTFDKIQLEGAFSAAITAGATRTHVIVSGEPAAVSRVTTEVHDRTLVVGMRSGSSLNSSPRLTIELPTLRGFRNEGAGDVKISGISGREFTIENAGAATIVASGRVASETISLDGMGKIDTTSVDAHDVTVDNNGVGSVRVRATGSLTMTVNGVGDIRYAGNPANVQSNVNGIGRISRL